MAAPPPPPPRGGFSLYGNLQDPNDTAKVSTTISSAPVRYNQPDELRRAADGSNPKTIDPSLRFQPIRRPQAKQQNKPKATFPKPVAKPAGSTLPTTAAPPQQKSTLADWAATEDDGWQYNAVEKRQRGGRKKKRRKQEEQMETDWDELYDPSKPTNVEEFLRSDEKVAEVREWKNQLYAHRAKDRDDDISDDDSDEAPTAASGLFSHESSSTYLHDS